MKKKIISSVVISTVAAWMLIWVVRADFSKLPAEEKIKIEKIIHKAKKWENLTVDEQNKLNEIKAEFEWKKDCFLWEWKKHRKWRNGYMKWLSKEEKESIIEMSDSEKKAFFEEKKAFRLAEKEDRRVIREWYQIVIEKLINWKELNDDEKLILDEIKKRREKRKNKY